MTDFKNNNGTNGEFPSFLLEGVINHHDKDVGLRWLDGNRGRKFCSDIFKAEYNNSKNEVRKLAKKKPWHSSNLYKLLNFIISDQDMQKAYPLSHIQNIINIFIDLNIEPAPDIFQRTIVAVQSAKQSKNNHILSQIKRVILWKMRIKTQTKKYFKN